MARPDAAGGGVVNKRRPLTIVDSIGYFTAALSVQKGKTCILLLDSNSIPAEIIGADMFACRSFTENKAQTGERLLLRMAGLATIWGNRVHLSL